MKLSLTATDGPGRRIAVTGQLVLPGDIVDVPSDVAKALLEQPDVWRKAPQAKKAPAKKAPSRKPSKKEN